MSILMGRVTIILLFVALSQSCDQEEKNVNDDSKSSGSPRFKSRQHVGRDRESVGNKYFSASTSEILDQVRKNDDGNVSVELITQAGHNVKSKDDLEEIIKLLEETEARDAQRSAILVAAFGSLARKGMALEALELIEERFGVGNLRNSLIASVFSNLKTSADEMIVLAESLDLEAEKSIAYEGISHSVSLDLSDLGSGGNAMVSQSPQAKQAVGSAVAMALARPNNSSNAEQVVRMYAHDENFIKGFTKYGTWEALQLVWPGFSTSSDNWGDEARKEFLRSSSRLQPRATLENLAKLPQATVSDVRQATKMWLDSEPNSASLKILDVEFSSSAHRDGSIIEVVRYAVEHDEKSSAAQWVGLISDDLIRKEALKLVEGNAKKSR